MLFKVNFLFDKYHIFKFFKIKIVKEKIIIINKVTQIIILKLYFIF